VGQGELSPPDRDRDEAGRPRSARPRDRAGRPLPRRPGRPAPTGGEAAALGGRAAIRRAQQLIDAGNPFAAHEVLEAEWKAARSDRPAWRGLAQLAVGLAHLQRGNRVGAVRLLQRGADNVEPATQRIDGVAGDIAAQARELAGRVEAGEPARPWLALAAGAAGPARR
jgi:hypothetical protein